MTKYKDYLLLHILILFLSVSGIFSKMAANTPFLSIKFFLCYSVILFILFVYALIWQQLLKKIPLTTGYCNKAAGIVWGMIFGFIIFGESISWQNIIGACIVFLGIYLVVTADE